MHHAITADLLDDTFLSDLPPYIARDHDGELDKLLGALTNNLMVVLVGGSSTGKTRAAYEAVRRNLNDWPIIHPTTGDDLLALLEPRSLDPRTVLWLNDTQTSGSAPCR